jgi:hypothetical protein
MSTIGSFGTARRCRDESQYEAAVLAIEPFREDSGYHFVGSP